MALGFPNLIGIIIAWAIYEQITTSRKMVYTWENTRKFIGADIGMALLALLTPEPDSMFAFFYIPSILIANMFLGID